MHAVIINGSPRVKKYSNTDKIIGAFSEGMKESGATCEVYEVSDKKQWEAIRKAFLTNENILIALPLFVECIPGILMEFLETLEPVLRAYRESGSGEDLPPKKLSFILQSGFAEGVQLRCGEAYLEKLAGMLGCEYGGTLVKGDNFSIRLVEGEQREKMIAPYKEMGRLYGENGHFRLGECRNFTGPEEFPAPVRLLVGVLFKTVLKKHFRKAAAEWGCTKPLTDRPYC